MKKFEQIVDHYYTKITIMVIGWTMLFLGLVGGGINAYANSWINTQYQGKQQQALITDVNRLQVNSFNTLIRLDPLNLVFTTQTKNKFATTVHLIALRDDNTQTIDSFYNGKYYADNVTTKKLDQTDKSLLDEKNQTVYQKQKNKLDKIRIWFDQSRDADRFLSKTYKAFQSDPQKLSTTKVSETNVYYKLIKNKKLKNKWKPKVQEITKFYEDDQKNKTKEQLAKEKAELEALKNSPLTTDSFTPAHVTVIDELQHSDMITQKLQQAGIRDNSVLFYSRSSQSLTLVHRNGNKYLSAMRSIDVRGGSLGNGSYRITQLVSNPPDTAGVITDRNNSGFGRYSRDVTAQDMGSNSSSDFNQAQPVFWFRNNAALQTSVLFSNGSTFGFISTASGLNNNLSLNANDLATLMSNLGGTSTLYVG